MKKFIPLIAAGVLLAGVAVSMTHETEPEISSVTEPEISSGDIIDTMAQEAGSVIYSIIKEECRMLRRLQYSETPYQYRSVFDTVSDFNLEEECNRRWFW